MAEGSLSPFYYQTFSHSVFGPHVQTVPLKGWSPGAPGTAGDLELWDGTSADAETAINDFIDLQTFFFPVSNVWDYTYIYSKPTPTSDSTVVAGIAHTQIGVNVGTTAVKAVQGTWSFKCDDNSIYKLVMLDVQNGGSFEKVNFAGLAGPSEDLVNFIVSDQSFIMSRLDGRPAVFLQLAFTMNEKLRRSYHMT